MKLRNALYLLQRRYYLLFRLFLIFSLNRFFGRWRCDFLFFRTFSLFFLLWNYYGLIINWIFWRRRRIDNIRILNLLWLLESIVDIKIATMLFYPWIASVARGSHYVSPLRLWYRRPLGILFEFEIANFLHAFFKNPLNLIHNFISFHVENI